MKPRIAFLIYRYLLVPLARILVSFLRPLLPKKLYASISLKNETPIYTKENLRFPLDLQQSLQKQITWIHAASGEIEYARPVLREWKLRFPQSLLLVTYTSPTSLNIWRHIPEVDIACPLPWDQPQAVRNFLDQFKPRRLCIARTDLWPELLYQTRLQNISIMLFSATFSNGSKKTAFLARALTQFCLQQMDAIYVVSSEDKLMVDDIQKDLPVRILGDTRFDQVQFRLEHPRPIHNINFGKHYVIVAGSTWEEDENVILGDLSALLGRGRKLVLVPHEIDEAHIRSLSERIEQQGKTAQLYTNIINSDANSVLADVLIVDKVGILVEVYSWGHVAFVGGSFKSQVHSVMEPLASGLPTLVGPFFGNNREAQHFQMEFLAKNHQISMVRAIMNQHDFLRQVDIFQDEFEKRGDYRFDVKARVLNFAGATTDVVNAMSHL